MKHLKQYEANKPNKPNIGDYIITNSSTSSSVSVLKKLHIFLNNNIGKVINHDNELIVADYENVPEDIKGLFRGGNYQTRRILPKDIEYHSNNKEDVETYITSKQYNL